MIVQRTSIQTINLHKKKTTELEILRRLEQTLSKGGLTNDQEACEMPRLLPSSGKHECKPEYTPPPRDESGWNCKTEMKTEAKRKQIKNAVTTSSISVLWGDRKAARGCRSWESARALRRGVRGCQRAPTRVDACHSCAYTWGHRIALSNESAKVFTVASFRQPKTATIQISINDTWLKKL